MEAAARLAVAGDGRHDICMEAFLDGLTEFSQ
jgi:hypothetical protein